MAGDQTHNLSHLKLYQLNYRDRLPNNFLYMYLIFFLEDFVSL
jgi:hypothetical protein